MADTSATPEALHDLAIDLARAAGTLAADMSTQARTNPKAKATPTDLVTAGDIAAERQIVEGILAARPNDSILGEEGAAVVGDSGVRWHIDPIDGTRNYVQAIPMWCVSIAAEVDGQIVAGAVFNPSLDEMFHASIGQGAWCDDRRLWCSNRTELANTIVATGFARPIETRAHQGQVIAQLLPHIADLRRIGSAALDLCFVADAQVDIYFEQGLNQWDLAAGSLIATEAGAQVGNLHGGPMDNNFGMAAPPALFDQAKALLIEFGA